MARGHLRPQRVAPDRQPRRGLRWGALRARHRREAL